jgi:cobalt/nickel transport system permease protein
MISRGPQHRPNQPAGAGEPVSVISENNPQLGCGFHGAYVKCSDAIDYFLRTIRKRDYPGVMHAPDGFLNAGTAVATGALSLGTVTLALRQAKHHLQDRLIPLAGITAAFIFAAQMFNFPVAAGTTGHLLGGALAAILLGPSVGVIVVTIVVVIQALAFADGGLTALGYNILNMAVIPAFGGYAAFRLFRRWFPKTTGGVTSAVGLAAWASVVMSSVAFSIQWLFGATAPVAFDDVLLAMVGVHILIGIGEGVISALAVGAVLASRPDLVYGASDLDRAGLADTRVKTRTFLIGGALVALAFAAVVSQFAVDNPDGLERVAEDAGIASSAAEHALADSLFADYATSGLSNESLSLAVAGVVGTLVTLAVVAGIFLGVRDRRGRDPAHI